MNIDRINEITGEIVDGAMRVHSTLGPGLLESAYQACLAHELRKRGFCVRTEVPMPLVYDGLELEVAYRIDMLVEEVVIVENKAVAKILPVHEAQLLSQLRLSGRRVGLLINYHVTRLKHGITRMVNRL
jgi:GxxExxY protein